MDMARQLIHRPSGDPVRSQALGVYRIEPLLTEAEEASATFYRVKIAANQRTGESFHKIAEEFYFVLSGSATALLDGSAVAIKPGDFLRLPPGTKHAFVTAEEPLEMLDIHVPGCRPDRDTYFVKS